MGPGHPPAVKRVTPNTMGEAPLRTERDPLTTSANICEHVIAGPDPLFVEAGDTLVPSSAAMIPKV
jgi:hypothetical protein